MKIDFKTCTEEDLWKYQSGDLDLILTNFFVKNVPEVMKEIGFIKQAGRHYVHPDCKHLYVEFPKGPLEIGDDSHVVPDEVKVEGKKIKILSPTDCVKDRLATYIHFKDRVGLEQAQMVAKKHPVNFENIETWCKKENAQSIFQEFFFGVIK
jgi:hypothetical protein